MATLTALRQAVGTALAGEGVALRDSWTGEPPYAVMFLSSSDLTPFARDGASVKMEFSVAGIVSRADDGASLADCDVMALAILAALVTIDGMRIDSFAGVQRQTVGTDTMYTVTYTVSAMTDI